MTTSYAQHLSTKATPQNEPIPGSNQIENDAGGFSFAVDCWTRLDRFLILGAESGTYYATERKLTQDAAKAVVECAKFDGVRTVNRIVEVSVGGRAPKNDAAIFALALVAAQNKDLPLVAKMALDKMPAVCRTGTHLFQFVEAVNELRGWGRGLRSAVRNWYADKAPDDMAYQCLKYQQRNGWSHKNVMHLAHLRGTGDHKTVQNWIEKGWNDVGEQPHEVPALQRIWAFERLKRFPTPELATKFIGDYGLTREMLPTELLNSPAVWDFGQTGRRGDVRE